MCLISYKYNFICFQVPKTGSTSMHKLLEPYIDSKLANIHSTYLEAKEVIDPEFFKQAFKFTVIRNPYRWITSMYGYIKSNPAHHLHEEFSSFEDFVDRHQDFIRNQSDYICDDNGEVAVHTVKLEAIEQDLPILLSGLGIEIQGGIPCMNKGNNILDKINKSLKKDFSYGYYLI